MLNKIFLFVLISCLSGFNFVYSADVAIISSRSVSFFADTVQGIKSVVEKKGPNVCDIYYSEDGDVVEFVRAKRYSVICTLGASSSQKIIASIKDVPIVFSIVVDPVKSNIVTPSSTNVAGVILDSPVSEQVAIAKNVIPGLNKVGMVYSSQGIDFFRDLSALISVQGVKVDSDRALASVIKNFESNEISIFWIPMDAGVYNKDSLAYVLSYCLNNKIPVFGFASNIVKAGALMSCFYDYNDIGVQAGGIVVDIINGKAIKEIGMVYPRKIGYVINDKVAKLIGVPLSSSAIKNASEVY